jgi:hypothetical protein
MLGLQTYKMWTAVFCEGSYYEGTWTAGDRIRFLAPNGSGLSSVIAESRPPEYVSIKHLCEIIDGVEDTTNDRARGWTNAFENYTFTAVGGETEVSVAMDIPSEYEAYMRETWPKALAQLKLLCEDPVERGT